MKSIAIAVAFLVISLCQFQILAQTPQTPTTSGGNDLITKTCSSTPHVEMCKTILQSSPNSKGADLYGLAQIVMNIAASNVSNIYESINQLQNGTTVDSFLDSCLTDCLESYQDAIDQIEDSVTALEFKAYNDVNTWVSAAMSDAATCDMGFKEKQGYQSPIAQMTTVFDQICKIILAINKLLSQGNSN
ncbi:putative invertase inhibitor [Cucumis melo var. makuwa]|uniref:Invertase inhibitor n=2 Tax=Cucumis melo TaxID=3656 RepID=A0A1S3BQL1_CUCME|nr:putative invertase inhibitor [Cucumis melo]KAA0050919.1 putative invertase inhibitor [Cucumis melo var. makuwa]TYK10267.1 putative invertase inhibitor [Cucumis melo var. makuwa]